ncbi:LON peptidase substrate-binding domain-containing protein [Stutzerimonas nitrititolerans]|uniref:LON peptidase substrate-binding domain-containing protein n=1 Tax=Stutzerimonas nitrititolerans TaxID=2482751 RepID=A0AA42BEA3_9GAMM|nr:LON peptidase substrate-binding domain-containing protein [Stutzerimonas nitrititolerans]AFN79502.1 ATP-dependent protease La [Stutzerimonas stutzeri DSM 10701]KRW71041.1 ATP-dependent protease [Pseudomonas sp. TTU2014-066ASC]RRV22810.1 ATP-dependent protease [Pseudomonas sp. s199]SUD86027.1 ATP-dependent protease La [Stutzerimonas stutzeri]MCO7545470.1 LON peptidase substrate-binding domain-containing protein [Stutzerimonas nitrititolerans]
MRLPLFPLDTVLFPGCILDLQLFEARYLDMISRCLKADHGFGVVRILQGLEVGPAATAFAGIGCEAVIRDWQQQPNGLLGIRVEGQRRFDIERTEVQADQLIVADVRWRPEPDDAPLDDSHADLVMLLEALRQHPMVRSLGMNDAVGGRRALADQLAYLLPFQPEHKIELLQLEDVDLRLQRIQTLLERLQGD